MFMRNYVGFLLFFVLVSPSIAQQANFIYIQTENNLPYKVEWNGAGFVSSSTGYLVIPQVAAGSHTLNIFFAADISRPYSFIVEVTDKARGFSLRQATDNSWSLFDMIDFSLVKGTLYVEPKPVPVLKPVINDTPVLVVEKKEIAAPLVVKEQSAKTSTAIRKIFDKTGSTGIDQVYTITNGNKIDTIALFIPDITEEKPKQGSLSSFHYQPAYAETGSEAILAYNNRRYPRLSK